MWHGNVLFSFSCQFIVKEDGDYGVHTVDPDKLVDWDMIEQIVRKYCICFFIK